MKFTYNNITYITEDDEKTSVTCYAEQQLPIEAVLIDDVMRQQVVQKKYRIQSGITAITSHTVLVVDQSRSMNQGDVMGHRSRSRGVFYTIANEMIAVPLLSGTMSFTDVVTLIEMRTDSTVRPDIYREPFTWDLHNKIVALASRGEALRGKGHGNYIPAIKAASDVLTQSDNQNAAVNLFFLSDGSPSDMSNLKTTPAAIFATVQEICDLFGDRLTVGTFGFAHDDGTKKFDILAKMAETATRYGSKGIFSVGVDADHLRRALSAMTSSLVSSRTAMSSLTGGSVLRLGTSRKVKRHDLKKDDAGMISMPLTDEKH